MTSVASAGAKYCPAWAYLVEQVGTSCRAGREKCEKAEGEQRGEPDRCLDRKLSGAHKTYGALCRGRMEVPVESEVSSIKESLTDQG